MSICMSVCLFVCLYVYLYVCMSICICMYIYIYVCLFYPNVYMFILSEYMSVSPSIPGLSVYPFVSLSVKCLSIDLSDCLSPYTSAHTGLRVLLPPLPTPTPPPLRQLLQR
jgi:hypothetical protein